MRDLERELRELSSAIMVPPTPDLARAAHIRLRTTRPAASWPRRPLVLALVIAIVLVAGLAVSPARTAILRFFGIGAVQIELVDRLSAARSTRRRRPSRSCARTSSATRTPSTRAARW
jgi:hypothetical protein